MGDLLFSSSSLFSPLPDIFRGETDGKGGAGEEEQFEEEFEEVAAAAAEMLLGDWLRDCRCARS